MLLEIFCSLGGVRFGVLFLGLLDLLREVVLRLVRLDSLCRILGR